MNNIFEYRGFIGIKNSNCDTDVLQGEIVNLNETVIFTGENIEELVECFHCKVDEYIINCSKQKEEELYRCRCLINNGQTSTKEKQEQDLYR